MNNDNYCDSLTELHGQALRNLARIKGQVGGIQKMIGDGSYCLDVLTQIHAARSALDSVSAALMQNHLESCCTEAIKAEDKELALKRITEFSQCCKKFIKS